MNYSIQKKDAFNVIGVELHVPEVDQAPYQIGKFWQTFRTQNIKERIPNKMDPTHTITVYTNYGKQGYSLILGARVQQLVTIPDDMVGITIPTQTYAVFSTQGAIPEIIQSTWQEIWDSPIERAYTYDFEVYKDERLNQADVDIYIALKPDYTQAA